MTRTALVLGAGMVGVSCALALQKRGFAVTIVDRREPGRETSYGNAGVISRSSVVALNSPELFGSLRKYLGNRHAALNLGRAPAGWRASSGRPGRPAKRAASPPWIRCWRMPARAIAI